MAALEALAPRWRGLLDRAASPEPTQTPLWQTTWWREFGPRQGRKLRVLAFEDEGGRLLAIAPLLSRRFLHQRIVPFRRLELLASGEDEADEICSNYIGVLCESGRELDVARELVRALLAGVAGPWDELAFSSMSRTHVFVSSLERALAESSVEVSLTPSGRCPYVVLPETWAAYLEVLRPAQRDGVARALAALEAWAGGPHGYALHRASSIAELESARAVLVRLHEDERRGRGERGAFSSERFSRFHRAVMRELFEGNEGALDLLWLTVGEAPVAALYNIVYRGKSYAYQSGLDANVPQHVRAGLALHALAIKRAIEMGMREYDFLQGASTYEEALCSDAHVLVELRAVAPTPRARALESARVAIEKTRGRLRR